MHDGVSFGVKELTYGNPTPEDVVLTTKDIAVNRA
jgi:hypothetical protein